jgi:hypothetical protein
MSEIAYELRYPDGHWVRLYDNGHVEGVPSGTLVVNWVHHLLISSSLRVRQECEAQAQGNPQDHCHMNPKEALQQPQPQEKRKKDTLLPQYPGSRT